jgi:chromosome segregation ATPase
MDSIKKVTNVELKENKEKLLNSMRILMHTAKGVFESTPFRDKDIAVGTGCHNLVIEAGGDTYPVFYTPDTMFADGTVAITDDIYDEENYLLLSDDDDMLWLSLVMQLDTLYKDECERSNGLDEALKEANKKCTEYVKEIDKLEVDNKRLSERVKTLVIEKTNRPDTAEKVSDPTEDLHLRTLELLNKITELENENESLKKKLFCGVPTKFGEQERLGSKQANEIIEDCEASKETVKMDMEMAIMHQNNLELHTKVALLTSSLESAQKEIESLSEELDKIKSNNAYLKKEKEEAELLAYRLTRGDMHVQFDSMKSLEWNNSILKKENADLNQKLYQKEDEDDLKKKIAEYAQKNYDLLERNKRLNQEINKFRVQLNSYSGVSVVNNDDMQQKITKETFAELTARINELETTLKDKDERINQLSKNNAALSVENKNISDLLQEADRNVRFYVREVDNLEKEIKDLQSKALSDGEDIIDENHDEEESNQSIEMDMEKQKKKREHLKHLLDLMDDLM